MPAQQHRTAPDTAAPHTIHWKAAGAVANRLGVHTRQLVEQENAEEAIEWALLMSRQNVGVRSTSYFELAVLLGHRDPVLEEADTGRWGELARTVRGLVAIVEKREQAERESENAQARQEADARKATADEARKLAAVPEGASE